MKISELLDSFNACKLVLEDITKSSESYRGVPSVNLTTEEKEDYRELTQEYKKFKTISDKIMIKIRESLLKLDV